MWLFSQVDGLIQGGGNFPLGKIKVQQSKATYSPIKTSTPAPKVT